MKKRDNKQSSVILNAAPGNVIASVNKEKSSSGAISEPAAILTIPQRTEEGKSINAFGGSGVQMVHKPVRTSAISVLMHNLDADEEIIGDDERENVADYGTPREVMKDEIIIEDEEDELQTNIGITDDGAGGQTGTVDVLDFKIRHRNDDKKYAKIMNAEMIKVHNWLTESVMLPQYFDNFVENGYESLNLISYISDKSELKDIAIHLIGHRTKIMTEINKLKIDD